jgi:trehalose 6-phosphate phosphatase
MSPTLPPDLPPDAALLLDLDGTLLDIAATPEAVVVPPGLPALLRRLRARLGDAVAVVTGRPVAQIDALLGDAPYAVAGEHGGAIRAAPGEPLRRADLPELPPDWLAAAAEVVARHPGSRLEPKARGFVLHYRQASDAGLSLQAAALAILGERTAHYVLLPAHMAWEVRPRGADKGTAVTRLLREAPFLGRVPVYIGDDVTDEDGMRAAREHGGVGLRVDAAFGDPAGVRRWLAQQADR